MSDHKRAIEFLRVNGFRDAAAEFERLRAWEYWDSGGDCAECDGTQDYTAAIEIAERAIEIAERLERYVASFEKGEHIRLEQVLGKAKAVIRYNADWYDSLPMRKRGPSISEWEKQRLEECDSNDSE